jgi:hypothetical protein
MASEAILKELLEVSKRSVLFKGMSVDDIWKACLSHADRSDEEVRKAMENIREKDQEAEDQVLKQQKNLERSKERMAALHEKEINDREIDSKGAEEVLEKLFK